MGLKYQPKVGSVLMCDFKGLIVPEIVKIRPVVVIARHRRNNKLVTVVPVSTTEPMPVFDYHYELSENPIPENEQIRCWVKCDMIMTVSTERLDRIKVRTWQGRNYIDPRLSNDEMGQIKNAVLHGIGMSHLVK
ncbi:type II toxin-antitoxin system PemK/MazF family toxin [Xenorhabdus griffiniae]|uniref:type II toxin-antitoxin system PemK/MazF family toxin n=1 Tax=Xenorhabdus griffiniae TaxID=351672 RepID=UPI002359E6B2|nr:type II toxin-antitoxin system PemK/MazF family toxin [Xenorhabdus griffiniae]MDC9606373.1 type II toxin-antitoxin system PemK/MazF family toxin [Xenorhabdus griffiniae]